MSHPISSRPDTPVPSPDALWVVCMCAEWCGACREYRAVFEQVARAQPGFRFAWVDIEDHAELADDFDVETFPTILIAGEQGTRFMGPLLPHAETLARLLTALPVAQPPSDEIRAVLDALSKAPASFSVGPASSI